jgi:hypothetical protein
MEVLLDVVHDLLRVSRHILIEQTTVRGAGDDPVGMARSNGRLHIGAQQ